MVLEGKVTYLGIAILLLAALLALYEHHWDQTLAYIGMALAFYGFYRRHRRTDERIRTRLKKPTTFGGG